MGVIAYQISGNSRFVQKWKIHRDIDKSWNVTPPNSEWIPLAEGGKDAEKVSLAWRQHYSLQWRHNGRDGVSNHQHHDCLLNRLFRRRSKKTSMLRVTGLCVGNSPGTGEFPAQMASNAENVSIWWRHHVLQTLWTWSGLINAYMTGGGYTSAPPEYVEIQNEKYFADISSILQSVSNR